MPVRIICVNPNCQCVLRIPDNCRARRVRCPRCFARCDAPLNTCVQPRYPVLAAGLLLVRAGLITAGSGVGAIFSVGALALLLGPGVLLVVISALGAVASLAGVILMGVGKGLCCAAPGRSGALGYAIAALVCFFLALLLALGGGLLLATSIPGKAAAPFLILFLAAKLLSLLEHIFF